MSRNLWQQIARIALIGSPLLLTPVFPEAASLGMLSLAALISYDGTTRHSVWRVFVFLLVMELVFALDIGTFLLPYLVGCALWQAAQHTIALTPWVYAEGWHAPDMARTAVSTALLWVVMVLTAVGVAAVMYGRGAFGSRVFLAFGVVPWEVLVFSGGLTLLLLRRIDIPFRERIHFGT